MKATLLLYLGIVMLAGCASTEYQYGTGRSDFDRQHSPNMPQQFVYGGGNIAALRVKESPREYEA